MAHIPYEEIQRIQDRSWTLRLLARLQDPSDPEHDMIVDTLERLADPRAVDPLTKILEDRNRSTELREKAATILRNWGNPAPATTLVAWWTSDDPVLERHALLFMDRAQADIVVTVAADPTHRLHQDGIATMIFGFEAPRFQQLKIKALDHADPRVRRTAADVLHWDEPVAAEGSLLRCLADPVSDVAIAAIKTLQYYPSLQTAHALASIVDHAEAAVGTEARNSLSEIEYTLLQILRHRTVPEREVLLRWMEPVREILEFSDDELVLPDPPEATGSPATTTTASVPPALSVDELVAMYSDPDGAWLEKQQRFPTARSANLDATAQARLVAVFSQHPDPAVRERSCSLLAAWNEQAVLMKLIDDPAFLVRKNAMYWLGQTSPDHALAPVLWEHLHRPDTTSTHAYETLMSYVTHAPRAESIPRLAALVRQDEREVVCYHAIHALAKFAAAPEIEALLDLLAEPPRVTWSIHIALLDISRKLGLRPPGLDRLYGVDNAYVQEALVPFRVA